MRIYLQGDSVGRPAREAIPTLRMLTEDAETVRERAEKLLGMMQALLDPAAATLSVVPEISRAGGGALPMCDIHTFAVKLEPTRAPRSIAAVTWNNSANRRSLPASTTRLSSSTPARCSTTSSSW
jgi:seryl-tRNA(Sec) selenium transferase